MNNNEIIDQQDGKVIWQTDRKVFGHLRAIVCDIERGVYNYTVWQGPAEPGKDAKFIGIYKDYAAAHDDAHAYTADGLPVVIEPVRCGKWP